MLRLLIALLFFGDAISTGLCATLCSAHLCCRSTQARPIRGTAHGTSESAPCCAKCRPHSQQGYSPLGPVGPNCCAWIAKKSEPPANLLALLATHQHHGPAVLPIALPIALPEIVKPAFHAIEGDDRAPPERRFDCSTPRAPPVA